MIAHHHYERKEKYRTLLGDLNFTRSQVTGGSIIPHIMNRAKVQEEIVSMLFQPAYNDINYLLRDEKDTDPDSLTKEQAMSLERNQAYA